MTLASPPEAAPIQAALGRARALVPLLAATADANDAIGRLPLENFPHLFDAQLLQLVIRSDKGGLGGGLSDAIVAVGTIAEGDPATALVLAMHYIQHGQIAADNGFWPETLANQLIHSSLERGALVNAAFVEPGIGSLVHGGQSQTIARRQGEQWRLSGHKKYVTGAEGLSWIRVAGVTDEAQPRQGFFLVPADAPGIRIEPTWDTLGMRATGSHDVVFEDVALPLENFFGDAPAGQGMGRHNPFDGIWYLLLVAAVYHGIAQAARNALVDFANEVAPGALGAPLATLPRFQDAIGQIEVWQTISARLLRSIGQDYDAHLASGIGDALHDELSAASSVARLTVIRNAIKVTSLALELAGNRGNARSAPFGRYHRDALAARAHNPQAHLIRLNLGNRALGRKPGVPARKASEAAASTP